MQLHGLDLAALLVYLVGMVAMGAYFARRNRDTEEYFVGGRRFPGWVVGLSTGSVVLSPKRHVYVVMVPSESLEAEASKVTGMSSKPW